jgi:hypothetical protein
MAVNRSFLGLASLGGGAALAAGGQPHEMDEFYSSEMYTSTNNTWTAGTSMFFARASFGLATLRSGLVLAAGGNMGGVILATAEVYNATNNTWSQVADMSIPRYVSPILHT